MNTTQEKRARFRALHQSGCFVIPNPWDIGSARLMEHLGFVAIATTSSGFAWTIGKPDNSVTLDDVLKHLTALAEATGLPLNADFESGFAGEPAKLAANVSLVIKTGVAGFSIEDRQVDSLDNLYERSLAVERIKAARQAIDQSGEDVILVARSERLLIDREAIHEVTDSLVAFAEAGADCLYAPGVAKKEDIAAMVRAVSPKPLNVLVLKGSLSVAELADLGVRRISVGGGLAKVGWTAVMGAAKEMLTGSFASLDRNISGSDLNKVFQSFR
jgi:2-methylisocitrate lyase-like PEP mutase family enzyme